MSCLICGQGTCSQRSLGDWEECCCVACGHYRVSRNLLIIMEIQGLVFNVEQTRTWLSTLQKIDPIPGIVSKNAICIKDPVFDSCVYPTDAG